MCDQGHFVAIHSGRPFRSIPTTTGIWSIWSFSSIWSVSSNMVLQCNTSVEYSVFSVEEKNSAAVVR